MNRSADVRIADFSTVVPNETFWSVYSALLQLLLELHAMHDFQTVDISQYQMH
jgi:hypothetical protein